MHENQMTIHLPEFLLNNVNELSSLTQKIISIKTKEGEKKFEIVKTEKSNFSRLEVSNEMFKILELDRENYSYIFTLNNYTKKDKLIQYFDQQNDVQIKFLQFYENNAQLNTIEKLEDTINWLYCGCIVIVIIFFILIILTTYNIIKDELERMYIERFLGFNKFQIKKYLLIKLLALNLIVVFFYIIINIISCLLIRNICNISLNVFNFYVPCIIIILLLISISLTLLTKVKFRYKKI